MNKFSIPFKVFIICAGVLGLCMQFNVGTSSFSLDMLCMFTTQSNIAVIVYFTCHVLALLQHRSTDRLEKWRILITLSISLTGLVAHFMLQDVYAALNAHAHRVWWIQHDIVPICTFLDWLIYDTRGRIRWWMPLFSTVFPLTYAALVMLVVDGLQLQDYPYPFLDVRTLGIGPVVLAVLGLSAGFILAGYLFYGLDRFIAWRHRPRPRKRRHT